MMKQRVFYDATRASDRPATSRESYFSHLSLSSRPHAESLRAHIEAWIARYPAIHRKKLVARLRDTNNANFLCAFTELYVYELLIAHHYKVQVEPRVGRFTRTQRRPDFRVISGSPQRWIVEVVVASHQSDKEHGADARLCDAIESLNTLESPDYRLDIQRSGHPRSPVPLNTLKADVAHFLRGLCYDDVLTLARTQSKLLPRLDFRHDGLVLTIRPIPRLQRGSRWRTVRVVGEPMRRVDSVKPLKKKLREKASRYGTMRQGYVIVVSTTDLFADELDIDDALFGTDDWQSIWPATTPQKRSRLATIDGFWLGPNGPRARNVSAVVVLTHLDPWMPSEAQAYIRENPWARYPCKGAFARLRDGE